MKSVLTIGLMLLIATVFFACNETKKEEDTPSSDHALVLHNCLVQLQEAVLAKDPVAIDSLMADDLKSSEAVDSLLSFIYGPDRSFPLVRFGNYNIIYVEDRARIDAFIMDSMATEDRPVEFTYMLTNDTLWYLKSFRVPEKPAIERESDSTDANSGE